MALPRLPRPTLADLLHLSNRARANAAEALRTAQQRRRADAMAAAALARRAEAERLQRRASDRP
jgi:hypothetical protein